MKQLIIESYGENIGENISDLIDALNEIIKHLENGMKSGHDRSDTRGYYFNLKADTGE